jgi:hypothetical protein
MAGKAKSTYVTVADKTTHKSVERKMFYNAKEANAFMKDSATLEKYPAEKYYIIKEVY